MTAPRRTRGTDRLAKIADAVLYEGYLLWPYRRSALKNRQRWTFGGLYPPDFVERNPGSDRTVMQTQVLAEASEGGSARVEIRIRFLHVVERRIARDGADGRTFVDELTIDGERHVAWDEAMEREIVVGARRLADLESSPLSLPIAIDAGSAEEALLDGTGRRRGAIVRVWQPLDGRVEVHSERIDDGLARLTVRVANTTRWSGAAREEAVRHTMASTHAILRIECGAFLSQTDPPEEHRQATDGCRNIGAWPVLAGDEGSRETMLASPIILYDWPQVAPESPGDLFDGGEIDQLLILSILGLTDDEQREMREADPRAREILDRCRSLSPDHLMKLHGTVRDLRPLRER